MKYGLVSHCTPTYSQNIQLLYLTSFIRCRTNKNMHCIVWSAVCGRTVCQPNGGNERIKETVIRSTHLVDSSTTVTVLFRNDCSAITHIQVINYVHGVKNRFIEFARSRKCGYRFHSSNWITIVQRS